MLLCGWDIEMSQPEEVRSTATESLDMRALSIARSLLSKHRPGLKRVHGSREAARVHGVDEYRIQRAVSLLRQAPQSLIEIVEKKHIGIGHVMDLLKTHTPEYIEDRIRNTPMLSNGRYPIGTWTALRSVRMPNKKNRIAVLRTLALRAQTLIEAMLIEIEADDNDSNKPG